MSINANLWSLKIVSPAYPGLLTRPWQGFCGGTEIIGPSTAILTDPVAMPMIHKQQSVADVP